MTDQPPRLNPKATTPSRLKSEPDEHPLPEDSWLTKINVVEYAYLCGKEPLFKYYSAMLHDREFLMEARTEDDPLEQNSKATRSKRLADLDHLRCKTSEGEQLSPLLQLNIRWFHILEAVVLHVFGFPLVKKPTFPVSWVVPPLLNSLRICTIFYYEEFLPTIESALSRVRGSYPETLKGIKRESWFKVERRCVVQFHSIELRETAEMSGLLTYDTTRESGLFEKYYTVYLAKRHRAGLLRDNHVRIIEIAITALIAKIRKFIIKRADTLVLDPEKLKLLSARDRLYASDSGASVACEDHHRLMARLIANENFRSERLELLLLKHLEDGKEANLKVVEGIECADRWLGCQKALESGMRTLERERDPKGRSFAFLMKKHLELTEGLRTRDEIFEAESSWFNSYCA